MQRDRVARAQIQAELPPVPMNGPRESPTRFSFIALVMPTKAREPFLRTRTPGYGQEASDGGSRWTLMTKLTAYMPALGTV